MELKRVLGFTSNNRNSFVSQSGTGDILYIAGCVVVKFNPERRAQQYLISESKQTITTLAISDDGNYLAAADCGPKLTIRVWNLFASPPTMEASLSGHNIEVTCMAFSANNEMLVSVGSQHDLAINLWDWRRCVKLAAHKSANKVRSVSFAADSSYFVTVGEAHIRYWYIRLQAAGDADREVRSIEDAGSISVSCRSANLANFGQASFCDVKCSRPISANSGNHVDQSSGKTFCITKQGFLCELNEKRLLHRWVDLRTSSANCLDVGQRLIVVGCANGVARCFSSNELRFLKNLPRPHALGTDIANRKQISNQSGLANYPDLTCVALDERTNTISCAYSDRSIYVWLQPMLVSAEDLDSVPLGSVDKKYSALYHSSCIWGIDVYPTTTSHGQRFGQPLACDTFVTCSSDDTLRIWKSLAGQDEEQEDDSYVYHNNVYSEDSLKIIFADPAHKFLCDLDCIERVHKDTSSLSGLASATNYDSNEGLRCLKLSSDGKHLAAGSRSGLIRVFDLELNRELKSIAAHDAEVLCLEYSDPANFDGYFYLASSSRDKLIHLFDASRDYKFLQTIDDHSSSITALRFLNNRSHDCLHLISCGTDQKIVFRNGQAKLVGQEKQLNFVTRRLIEGKTTFYDMEVDAESCCLMAACQDRMIRLFNVAQVKYQSGFKGSSSDEGTIIKLALDPSCTFLAASCTDKSVAIYDYQRGECVATISRGLSDLVTDMKFSLDGRHLITCSGNGCIFIWLAPAEVANASSCLAADQPIASSRRAAATNCNAGQIYERQQPEVEDWAKLSWSQSMLDQAYQVQQLPAKVGDSDVGLRASSCPEDADDQRTLRGDSRSVDSRSNSLVRAGSSSYHQDDQDDGQSSHRCARSARSSTSGRHPISESNNGPVSNMAKYFQSRDNLDKISSRQKYIHDGLFSSSASRRATSGASISGRFAGQAEVRRREERAPRPATRSLRAKSLSRLSHAGASNDRVSRRRANSSGDELSSADNGDRDADADGYGAADGDDDDDYQKDTDRGLNKSYASQKAATLNNSRRDSRRDESGDVVGAAERYNRRQTSGGYGTNSCSSSENRLAARHRKPTSNESTRASHEDECDAKLKALDGAQSESNSFEWLNWSRQETLVCSQAEEVYCRKLDLSKLDPNRVLISRELCQHVAEELRLISKFATRLHQRLQAGGSRNLANFVSRAVQNSLDILSIVPPRALAQHHFRSELQLSGRSAIVGSHDQQVPAPAGRVANEPPPEGGCRQQQQQQQVSGMLLRSAVCLSGNTGSGSSAAANVIGSTEVAAPRMPAQIGSRRSNSADHQGQPQVEDNHRWPASHGNEDFVRAAAEEPTAGSTSKAKVIEHLPAKPPDLELASGSRGTANNAQLDIDQVLEAYSDRLFRMVQQRMECGVSNNAPSLSSRELANNKQTSGCE